MMMPSQTRACGSGLCRLQMEAIHMHYASVITSRHTWVSQVTVMSSRHCSLQGLLPF